MISTYDYLRNMTPEMFADFGEKEVVYLKPVRQPGAEGENGESNNGGVVIHAANGDKLAVAESVQAALATAFEYDLAVTRLH